MGHHMSDFSLVLSEIFRSFLRARYILWLYKLYKLNMVYLQQFILAFGESQRFPMGQPELTLQFSHTVYIYEVSRLGYYGLVMTGSDQLNDFFFKLFTVFLF